jgi:iron(III) transport system ATP-binding protein
VIGLSRVQLSQVSKTFGEVLAVDQLDLTVREGEFFTLLGPSGCGKTTTLRMIAGFCYPTTGRIFFDDQDVTHVPPHRRDTGMVFQNYALFPHMTVAENVAFGLEVRKLPKKEITERVEQALEQVRLGGFGERRVSQLSGGQQQRVALARALVIRPRILLLDEPLSNLDARLRDEMRTEILSLQRSLGITTIYVTHDQMEALSMSDRIAVFSRGKCQQIGTPEELYNHPKNTFVASFVGETNLLPVTVKEKGPDYVTAESGNRLFRVKKRERDVLSFQVGESGLFLSIRPEAIRLVEGPGPNRVEGGVKLIQFTGTTYHCKVELEDGTELKALFLNRPDMREKLREGARMFFELPEDQLRLIPNEGGDAE